MSATYGRGGGMTQLAILFTVLMLFAGACSGDDDSESAGPGDTASAEPGPTEGTDAPRFCDAYLEYLADSSAEKLDAVASATDDPQVDEYATVIRSDAGITEILAATLDLDELARLECQPEWTGSAQGAGSTEAAAQVFYDAVVAGDRIGASNVAAANAIAVFEPWDPIPAAGDTPALVEVGEQTFTVIVDEGTLAHCQVEVGVVVSCQVQS